MNPLEEMKKLLCSRRLRESAVGKCNPSAQSVSLLVNYVSALGHEPLPGANPAQAPMMEFVQFGRTRATTLGHIVLDHIVGEVEDGATLNTSSISFSL